MSLGYSGDRACGRIGARGPRSRLIEEAVVTIHRWFEDYVFEVPDFMAPTVAAR